MLPDARQPVIQLLLRESLHQSSDTKAAGGGEHARIVFAFDQERVLGKVDSKKTR